MMKKLTLAALVLAANTAMATTTVAPATAASAPKAAASATKACVPTPAVTCGTKPKAKPAAKPASAPVVPTAVVQEKIVYKDKIVVKEVPVDRVVVREVPTALPVQKNAWKLEADYLYDNSIGRSGMRVQADSPWNMVGITPVAQYDYVPNAYQRVGLGLQYPLARMENTQFLVTGRGFYQDNAYSGSTGGGGLGLKLNTALTKNTSFVAFTEYNWTGTGKDGALVGMGLNYAF